ncbi:MAG: hypothetical protein V4641_05645 [Pseudomonadota bacterium]
MNMAGDNTDFNFSDEPGNGEGDDAGNTGGAVVHAGDGDEEGGSTEALDRGDNLTAGTGQEGDPDAVAAAAAAATGTTAGAADPNAALDPDFLASVAGDQPQLVPYARLAELAAQNQKLMGVLEGITSGKFSMSQPAAAEAAAEAEPAFDMKAQIRARNSALLEGDEDKAATIDMAIEEYRNTTLANSVRTSTIAEINQTNQKNQLDSIVADAFGKYTFLNDQTEEFNPEALDEVMMFRNHYVSKGNPLPVALAMAIDKVCPQYIEVDPVADATAVAAAAATTVAGGRDPTKVVRNARAAAAQPPATATAGVANRETIDVTKLNLETMDDDKYDALPETVKARLRGDAIA